MATEYVVLRKDNYEGFNVWVEHNSTEASSSGEAIRKAAQEGGAYVAIPKRSFQPATVEVETQPRVKIVS